MVGHRIPGEHPLFEARLSEKDFPWLKDHRVHHAAIMPAAGYIELILEALGGAAVHFDEIEFLQPCPIPKTPVRLQTALYPVHDSPDEFTFVISSRAFEIQTKSERHCRGRLRLIDVDHPVSAPAQLADIDRSRYLPVDYTDNGQFYENLEEILGDTFQYGPYFRTMNEVKYDPETKSFMFEVAMDEALWSTGLEEGYVVCPPLFDCGLQVFLYNLMRCSDLFAFPSANC